MDVLVNYEDTAGRTPHGDTPYPVPRTPNSVVCCVSNKYKKNKKIFSFLGEDR
jgi:hypothetical protein